MQVRSRQVILTCISLTLDKSSRRRRMQYVFRSFPNRWLQLKSPNDLYNHKTSRALGPQVSDWLLPRKGHSAVKARSGLTPARNGSFSRSDCRCWCSHWTPLQVSRSAREPGVSFDLGYTQRQLRQFRKVKVELGVGNLGNKGHFEGTARVLPMPGYGPLIPNWARLQVSGNFHSLQVKSETWAKSFRQGFHFHMPRHATDTWWITLWSALILRAINYGGELNKVRNVVASDVKSSILSRLPISGTSRVITPVLYLSERCFQLFTFYLIFFYFFLTF